MTLPDEPDGTVLFATDDAGGKWLIHRIDGTWEALGFPDDTPSLRSVAGCHPICPLSEAVTVIDATASLRL